MQIQYFGTNDSSLKNKFMKILLVITVIILAIVYAFSQTEISIDGQYVVLKKIKNMEIRAYKESVNASYY